MANIKRLKRLVTVLERVIKDPKKRREFHMKEWGVKTPDCGTHLCACGWAVLDPVLGKQGLKLVRNPERADWIGDKRKYLKLKFGRKVHMQAAAAFFEIDEDTAELLFGSLAYESDTAMRPVINRIKSVIKQLAAE